MQGMRCSLKAIIYLEQSMKLIFTLIMCSFFLAVLPPVLAEGGDIDLTIEGEVLSAQLRGIPLKAVLEKLEKEGRIWFKGNSSLLDERITVQFADLPLEEGLNRILASMNYSLVFDQNGRLVGVFVVARETADRPATEVSTSDSQRSVSSPAANERANANRPVMPTGKNTSQDNHIKDTKEDHEEFTVIRDCPPSGGPVDVPAGARESFAVIKNCPPPGGPATITPGENEKFRVIRNLPPPGGPVEVSAEERENFQLIENCPPPEN